MSKASSQTAMIHRLPEIRAGCIKPCNSWHKFLPPSKCLAQNLANKLYILNDIWPSCFLFGEALRYYAHKDCDGFDSLHSWGWIQSHVAFCCPPVTWGSSKKFGADWDKGWDYRFQFWRLETCCVLFTFFLLPYNECSDCQATTPETPSCKINGAKNHMFVSKSLDVKFPSSNIIPIPAVWNNNSQALDFMMICKVYDDRCLNLLVCIWNELWFASPEIQVMIYQLHHVSRLVVNQRLLSLKLTVHTWK